MWWTMEAVIVVDTPMDIVGLAARVITKPALLAKTFVIFAKETITVVTLAPSKLVAKVALFHLTFMGGEAGR